MGMGLGWECRWEKGREGRETSLQALWTLKMNQNCWRLGLHPRPHWGSLQHSPDLADPLGGSCFAVRGVTPKTLLQTRKPFNCGLHKIRVDRFLPEGGKNRFFRGKNRTGNRQKPIFARIVIKVNFCCTMFFLCSYSEPVVYVFLHSNLW